MLRKNLTLINNAITDENCFLIKQPNGWLALCYNKERREFYILTRMMSLKSTMIYFDTNNGRLILKYDGIVKYVIYNNILEVIPFYDTTRNFDDVCSFLIDHDLLKDIHTEDEPFDLLRVDKD